jgi:hypothetical protein
MGSRSRTQQQQTQSQSTDQRSVGLEGIEDSTAFAAGGDIGNVSITQSDSGAIAAGQRTSEAALDASGRTSEAALDASRRTSEAALDAASEISIRGVEAGTRLGERSLDFAGEFGTEALETVGRFGEETTATLERGLSSSLDFGSGVVADAFSFAQGESERSQDANESAVSALGSAIQTVGSFSRSDTADSLQRIALYGAAALAVGFIAFAVSRGK